MQRIEHTGTITQMDERHIYVTVRAQSACEGCHVRSSCIGGSAKEKIITADRSRQRGDFRTGDSVTVSISARSGVRAVLLAYMLPLIVLIAVLAVCYRAGIPDHFNALISLAFLLFYFIILFTFRRKLSRGITVKIDKIVT